MMPRWPERCAWPGEPPGRMGEGERQVAQRHDVPDVIVRIRALLPSLAPAEQRVGVVVTSDPERAARLTISELAREAETPDVTVVRFCRSINMPGYADLRSQ